MKTTALFTVLALSLVLSACGKSASESETAEAAAAEAQAQSDSAAAEKAAAEAEKPRLATFDPNLKPAQIVWDSPEKKRQWEERQAKIRAEQAAAQRGAPATAPAVAR